MIVLSGPSASGKTVVANLLKNKYGFKRVITTTTRDMRPGEIQDLDYHFVDVAKFKRMINEGLFVEYTIYNNNYYGSTKEEIADDKVIAIEPNGMAAYISLNNPRIVTFYLDVKEDIRYKRMIERGDSVEQAQKRIQEDKIRFNSSHVPLVDYIIDSEHYTIDDVAKYILKKYNEKIQK